MIKWIRNASVYGLLISAIATVINGKFTVIVANMTIKL